MKNITKLLIILAAAISFAACNKETPRVESQDLVLEISYVDATFGPLASEGKIVVNSDETVTAESAAEDWCTVSVEGNTVLLSVTAYAGLESRNTEVTVNSGNKSVTVPVHQEGLLVIIDAQPSYLISSAAASTVSVPVTSNIPIVTESNSEWLSVSKADKGNYVISARANETTDYRRGCVSFNGKEVWIGQVGTAGLDPVGTYTCYWEEWDNDLEDNVAYHMPGVEIVSAGTNQYQFNKLLWYGDGDNDYMPLKLWKNASTGEYYIQSMYSMGQLNIGGTNYTLRPMMSYWNASTGAVGYLTSSSTSATNAYRMSFKFSVDDKANLSFAYYRNSNLSSTYDTDGFDIYAFKSTTSMTATNRAGVVWEFLNVYFVKE